MIFVRDQIRYSEKIVLRILDLVIGVVEVLFGVRVILRILGANPGSNFVAWLYSTTDQMLLPFWNIFPNATISGIYVVEFSTLFAMLAYAFFGWAIMKLIALSIDTILRIDEPRVS